MKRFLKSLMLSLGMGRPLAVGLIFFLYTNQKEAAFEYVKVRIPEENAQTEKVVISDENAGTEETIMSEKFFTTEETIISNNL